MKQKSKFEQTEMGMIPEDWEELKLSEAIDVNPKRELKKGVSAKKVPMDCLSPFNKKIKRFEVSKFSGGSKFINGDTIMARITPCLENGKTAFVDVLSGDEVGFGSTEFIVLSGKNGKTTNDFVYYLSISPQLRKEAIKSMTGTSGRQRVQNDLFEEIELIIPPLPEQSAIAKILSDLDSKIELNQQMNKTLEEIGQTIFKRWFVDFEFPNEKGKPYKSSDGEMVKSELGKIPKGWKVGEILDEFNLTMGQSPPGISYNEFSEGISFFQGRTDFGFRYPTKRIFCTEPARFAKLGDTLVSVRAPVGDINMTKEKCCIGRGVAAIRHKTGSRSYTYYSMQNLREKFLNFEAGGTVFGSIGKTDFEEIKILMPSKEIINLFERIVHYIDQKIENNSSCIELLSQIRDSLLPRLMSGKIRVPVEVRA